MEKPNSVVTASHASFLLVLLVAIALLRGVQGTIGVNYGTVADNLPPPSEVARFPLENTILNRVRLFDANPLILQAFAHTGIAITIAVKANILPYYHDTNIIRILVGNEVLSAANKLLIGNLVPSMQNLRTALVGASLDTRIKVSTPHSLGILSSSSPPSTGKFRKGYDDVVLKPLLNFLRATEYPFMINPYPFFECSAETLDYALFRPNSGVLDENPQLMYNNMLDAKLDATFSAMKLLGFTVVDIVIAETGWPSAGDSFQVGVDARSAAQYNGNLLRHVISGIGTPLMPNRTFEAYMFALFNENRKPGPVSEKNFGLFQPDMTPVYEIGIFRPTARTSVAAANPTPVASPINPVPVKSKNWCIPKSKSGPCFFPDTVRAHAAYAMNMYYQVMGQNTYDCDFKHTGTITTVDPSYGNCKY
ncbi:hypothetical protein MKX01_023032 [Papaver californicum]|nr:hypothetical protein MKX01_023032 [Papaver californicum]